MTTMRVISNDKKIDFEGGFDRFFCVINPRRFSQIRSRDSLLFCSN